MKINIEIDCSPSEARDFLGLPDIQPMQKQISDEITKRIIASISSMDADNLMNSFMPAGIQGMENLQKMFWGNLSGSKTDDS